LHGLTSRELPQLADTLADWGIVGMPAGHAIFHGDLHPGNVLRDSGRWNLIDWSNAHVAPAAADVACAVLAIGYRGLRGPDASIDVHRRRVRAADRYLNAYRARSSDALVDFSMWMDAIGRLLFEQEPDLAFANDLAARWIHL